MIAVVASENARLSHRYTARILLLLIYCSWFVALAIGTLAYAGEPITVERNLLPLHHFDVLFRKAGVAMLFIVWAIRALIKHGLHAFGHGNKDHIWVPAGYYTAQAAIRTAIYHLHKAGILFSPHKWMDTIHDWDGKYPHIMSDHVLLAATVIGGLACEVVILSLALSSSQRNWFASTALKICMAFATVLALTMSAECFYTALYFHPPQEIVVAAVMGLFVFQLPLLMYSVRAFKQHGMVRAAVARKNE